jgi:hypothetical protein
MSTWPHVRYTCQVWARELEGGDHAVALYNSADVPQKITWRFSDLADLADLAGTSPTSEAYPSLTRAKPARLRLRDLWRHEDLGEFEGEWSATVPAHGAVVLRAAVAPRAKAEPRHASPPPQCVRFQCNTTCDEQTAPCCPGVGTCLFDPVFSSERCIPPPPELCV